MDDKLNETKLIANLAREREYVDDETLQEALLEVELSNKTLTSILREKGYIEPAVERQLDLALKFALSRDRKIQEDVLFLQMLTQAELVKNRDIDIARHQQQVSQKEGDHPPIRQVMVELGLITEDQSRQVNSLLGQINLICEKCHQSYLWSNLPADEVAVCPQCQDVLLPLSDNMSTSEANTLQLKSSVTPLLGNDESRAGDTAVEAVSPDDDTVVESHRPGDDTVVESQSSEPVDFDGSTTKTMIESGDGTSPSSGRPKTVTNDPLIGKKMGDTKLIKKLGQGGMGAVYLGENLSLGRREAIKVLTGDTSDTESVIRFKREAKAAGTLTSPHIVQVFHIGEAEGLNYISMEFVEGQSIQDIIEEKKKVPIPEAIDYIKQASKGLTVAHHSGITHRDIKPDNLMVKTDGVVKVADFGLARKQQDSLKVTQTGSILGTPYYMSPEQCNGEDTDGRSDIYSLGATFYYMLTGEFPFTGETPMAILLKHLHEEIVPPHELDSEIPLSLSNIIEKMMEKSPEYRYQTMEDFLADVEKMEEGEEIGISEGKRHRQFVKRMKRIAVAVVAVGLILFFSLYDFKSAEEQNRQEAQKMYQQAVALVEKGDLEEANTILVKAGDLHESQEAKNLHAEVLLGFGKECIKKAQSLIEEIKLSDRRGWEKLQNNTDLAKSYWDQAAKKKELIGEKHREYQQEVAALYLRLGRGYCDQIELKEARKSYLKAEKFQNSEEAKKGLAKVAFLVLLRDVLKTIDPSLGLQTAEDKVLKTADTRLLELDPSKLEGERDQQGKVVEEGLVDKLEKLVQMNSDHSLARSLKAKVQGEVARRKNLAQAWRTFEAEQKRFNSQLASISQGIRQALDAKLYQLLQERVSIKNENKKGEVESKGSSLLNIESQIESLQGVLEEMKKKIKKNQEDLPPAAEKLPQPDRKTFKEKYKLYYGQKIAEGESKLEEYRGEVGFIKNYRTVKNLLEDRKAKEDERNRQLELVIELAKKLSMTPEAKSKNFLGRLKEFRRVAAEKLFENYSELAKEKKDSNKEEGRRLFYRALKVVKENAPGRYGTLTKKTVELLAKLNTPKGMVYIPPGEYKLGTTQTKMKNPLRTVSLDSFYIAVHEVTQEEFAQFVKAGGYSKKEYWQAGGWNLFHGKNKRYKRWPRGWKNGKIAGNPKLPVTGICFYEAAAYARWKSRTLNGTCLPSQNQWEVAASYIINTNQRKRYPWGNKWAKQHLPRFQREGPYIAGDFSEDKSSYGCLDMAGNVSEWVTVSEGKYDYRGIRGGSFDCTRPIDQTSFYFARFSPAPEDRLYDVGFRLCVMTSVWKQPK